MFAPSKATFARAPSKSHGAPSGGVERKVAPPGTRGRIDMALVRQVLGSIYSIAAGRLSHLLGWFAKTLVSFVTR